MMPAKRNEFTKAGEVISIHLERYNRQIQKLLAVQDYCEEDLRGSDITRKEYYRAREKKIKAYNDCLVTLYQKERLLQYHSTGFEIEVIDEKTEINESSNESINWDRLTLEEQIEMLHLIQEMKINDNELLPIVQKTIVEKQLTEDIEYEVMEPANIEQIKIEELPAPVYKSPVTAHDPTIKLREALLKVAAKKFKEAGSTLDDEEKRVMLDAL